MSEATITGHTPGPWHVERHHAKGEPPEFDTFSVLAPNPDAGKEGVPYAGEHLSVAQMLDCEADAYLFAASLEMRDAIKEVLKDCFILRDLPADRHCDFITAHLIEPLRAAIAKTKAPPAHKQEAVESQHDQEAQASAST